MPTLNINENEFVERVRDASPAAIISLLRSLGVEFEELDFRDLSRGIYRREQGMDLLCYDGYTFSTVVYFPGDQSSAEPYWACFDEVGGDWWVQILDDSHQQVDPDDADRFRVTYDGRRVG